MQIDCQILTQLLIQGLPGPTQCQGKGQCARGQRGRRNATVGVSVAGAVMAGGIWPGTWPARATRA